MPRPTRFLFDVAPLGGLKFDKFVGTFSFLLRNHRRFNCDDYSVSLLVIAKNAKIAKDRRNGLLH